MMKKKTAKLIKKDEYNYDEIEEMVECVIGWFAITKKTGDRKMIEENRQDIAHFLSELSGLVAGTCMPVYWEGDYDEDGYTYDDTMTEVEEDGKKTIN